MINKKNILIYERKSIKEAFKELDKTAEKVLLVIDDKNRLLGTITDGDIRRYILSGKSLENNIKDVYNKKPIYIKKETFSRDLSRRMLIKNRIDLIPIINSENQVIDFITWRQAFSDSEQARAITAKIDIPLVIMAGGKGSRLDPFSKIFPKSLIPVGNKPIIEIIIGEFRKHGINKYYIMLNYKGEMIESYFNNIKKDYEIDYVWEEAFWGTAGSLKLLEDKIGDTFVVSNSDIIVKANFEEVLNLHKEQNASLTILSSVQYYKIPFGIIRFKEGGKVTDIIEKPEYTFTINTGVYVLAKESLQFIPKKSRFDMTDLIKVLIKNNRKVVTYPVNENDYIDVGQWKEYKKSMEKLQLFE